LNTAPPVHLLVGAGVTFESGPFHCGCGRVYRAPQTSAEGAALMRIWRKP